MKKCNEKRFAECTVVDLKDYDPEDSLLGEVKKTRSIKSFKNEQINEQINELIN